MLDSRRRFRVCRCKVSVHAAVLRRWPTLTDIRFFNQGFILRRSILIDTGVGGASLYRRRLPVGDSTIDAAFRDVIREQAKSQASDTLGKRLLDQTLANGLDLAVRFVQGRERR